MRLERRDLNLKRDWERKQDREWEGKVEKLGRDCDLASLSPEADLQSMER